MEARPWKKNCWRHRLDGALELAYGINHLMMTYQMELNPTVVSFFVLSAHQISTCGKDPKDIICIYGPHEHELNFLFRLSTRPWTKASTAAGAACSCTCPAARLRSWRESRIARSSVSTIRSPKHLGSQSSFATKNTPAHFNLIVYCGKLNAFLECH